MKKRILSICVVVMLVLCAIPAYAYTDNYLDSFYDNGSEVSFVQQALNNDYWYEYNGNSGYNEYFNLSGNTDLKLLVYWSGTNAQLPTSLQIKIVNSSGQGFQKYLDLTDTGGYKEIFEDYNFSNGTYHIEIVGYGLTDASLKVEGIITR